MVSATDTKKSFVTYLEDWGKLKGLNQEMYLTNIKKEELLILSVVSGATRNHQIGDRRVSFRVSNLMILVGVGRVVLWQLGWRERRCEAMKTAGRNAPFYELEMQTRSGSGGRILT